MIFAHKKFNCNKREFNPMKWTEESGKIIIASLEAVKKFCELNYRNPKSELISR
jgi:hypothetical protein